MVPTAVLYNGDSTALLAEGLRVDAAAAVLGPEVPASMKRVGLLRADAGVTDPPYGFDFSGEKDWDTFSDARNFTNASDDSEQFAKFTEKWAYGLKNNALKFGSHLLAFTAGRTIGPVDRGLQRAGYAVPRILFWLYASGQVKNPNDLRPGCEPIFCGRVITDSNGKVVNDRGLTEAFKKDGLGQFHAQTWKAEDGKHPTDVIFDETIVEGFEEVAQIVEQHPGTFFVPKPSPKERDWGCADLPLQKKDNRLSHMTSNYTGKEVKDVMAQNVHPTVKSIALMRRLVRLVSRPGHTIIDPFMGSGTTGIAAILEGRNFIGIEREAEFLNISKVRIGSAIEEFAAHNA